MKSLGSPIWVSKFFVVSKKKFGVSNENLEFSTEKRGGCPGWRPMKGVSINKVSTFQWKRKIVLRKFPIFSNFVSSRNIGKLSKILLQSIREKKKFRETLQQIKYLNINISICKPMIFQTQIIWSNRIHSLIYCGILEPSFYSIQVPLNVH